MLQEATRAADLDGVLGRLGQVVLVVGDVERVLICGLRGGRRTLLVHVSDHASLAQQDLRLAHVRMGDFDLTLLAGCGEVGNG